MIVRRCRNCGEEFQPHVSVCSDCGGPLEDHDPDVAAPPVEDPPAPVDRRGAVGTAVKVEMLGSLMSSEEAEACADVLARNGLPYYLDVNRDRTFRLSVPLDHAEAAARLLQDAGAIPRRADTPAVAVEGGPCPACGAHVDAGSRECPDCGLSLGQEAPTCAKCGTELDAPWTTCPRCGGEE